MRHFMMVTGKTYNIERAKRRVLRPMKRLKKSLGEAEPTVAICPKLYENWLQGL